ncbi:MAG: deoxynucleoside kinase [Gammaproteobacteria bacterium]|nr:deoxynucleoside kinase [Gammaproteobacteria bacterium]
MHITVDGMDGVGKTTLIRMIMDALKSSHNLLLCDALKSNPYSLNARKMLVNNCHEMHPKTEALLLSSVHVENYYHHILPFTNIGKNVISDRSILSTMAYQGHGAILKSGNLDNLEMITAITGDLKSDIEIIIVGDPEACIERCKNRSGGGDKIENSSMNFHRLVNSYFVNRTINPGVDTNKIWVENYGSHEQFINNCYETVDWLKGKLTL